MARPRGFEPDTALAQIKDAFWRRGFDATSMQDIEAATGLKKQSLYRLYGDKRGMYLKALDHYGAHEAAEAAALLAGDGSAKARFERLFTHVVDSAVKDGDRRGCFLCNASIDQAPVNDDTRVSVARLMKAVRDAFDGALAASEPYKSKSAVRKQKAALLLASYFGLRVLVRAGMDEAVLRAAVRQAVAGI